MAPFQLIDMLVSRGLIAATRVKDIRTSVQKLADASHLPVDTLDLGAVSTTYEDTLSEYFAQLSPAASTSTQRNTRQNLRQLYRALETYGFHAVKADGRSKHLKSSVLLKSRGGQSPYKVHYGHGTEPYFIHLEDWPAAIRQGWEDYLTSRTFDIRPTTVKSYYRYFVPYVSFGLRLDTSPLSQWDEVFQINRLTRFITWHAKRLGLARISHTGLSVANLLVTMAGHLERQEHQPLKIFVDKLPVPVPVHNKQAAVHTISATEIENVALAMLEESRSPLAAHTEYIYARELSPQTRYPRLLRASQHSTSLILRLMWRIPVRSRSIREMQLGKNLSQDASGTWWLTYQGDELKVRERQGKLNSFRVPWPTELVAHLEEYLREMRPRFPNADTDFHVFLTRHGRPFSVETLWGKVANQFYVRTGKRLYPHLFRTLWTDQYLLATNGDVSTAAYMLNDNVNTVLRRYHELRGADHVQKAFTFNQAILRKGKTP